MKNMQWFIEDFTRTMLQISTDVIFFQSHNNLIDEASLVWSYKGVYSGSKS